LVSLNGPGGDNIATLADTLQQSGADIAILCGSDTGYESLAADLAKALTASGAKKIYLAGHPGEKRASYENAGISRFIHVGCDVLKALQDAQDILGCTIEGDQK